MPTQPPYVNHAYWEQLRLLDGGFQQLCQRFQVYLDGPRDLMVINVEMWNYDQCEFVELEGPVWRGPLGAVPLAAGEIGSHIFRAQEYLRPF